MLINVILGFIAGAICGAVAGHLLSALDWRRKDLRDELRRSRRLPLQRDRVYPRYHLPLLIFGSLHAGMMSALLPVSPVWIALSVFLIPALCLPFLLLMELYTRFKTDRRKCP